MKKPIGHLTLNMNEMYAMKTQPHATTCPLLCLGVSQHASFGKPRMRYHVESDQ